MRGKRRKRLKGKENGQGNRYKQGGKGKLLKVPTPPALPQACPLAVVEVGMGGEFKDDPPIHGQL